ncbi:MAG: hypothetical protein IT183_08255 [Acidobacteria bacterium]|nr:hypothetical protein [Acidobacteriota bacterium]
MRITMVKKTLADGSDCRKCAEATEHLQSRGLWHHIDEVVWAHEDDPSSAGMVLGTRLNVERAPFFIVHDDAGNETVYTSVLQLVRERLGRVVSDREQAMAIDAADIGGI